MNPTVGGRESRSKEVSAGALARVRALGAPGGSRWQVRAWFGLLTDLLSPVRRPSAA